MSWFRCCPNVVRCLAVGVAGMGLLVHGSQGLSITRLTSDGWLEWSNPFANRAVTVEVSTNLLTGAWSIVATVPPNSGESRFQQPLRGEGGAFYRVSVPGSGASIDLTSGLLLHLDYENNFYAEGKVEDRSGLGHHGLRFAEGHWPTPVAGPDGRQAAEFHEYYDGRPETGKSGDYIVVLQTPQLDNLPQATFMSWAYYYPPPPGKGPEHTTKGTIIDAASRARTGAWHLGRSWENRTSFLFVDSNLGAQRAIIYPDFAPTGATDGWNHYAVTFDGKVIRGYYNGREIGTYSNFDFTKMTLGQNFGTKWIAVGCDTHGGTPEWEDVDAFPNSGWMNGAIDDTRIYSRALSAAEIAEIHRSFDKVPPKLPNLFTARAGGPSRAEIRWSAAEDRFGIALYRLRRNGTVLVETATTSHIDLTVEPGKEYSYTLECIDIADHSSGESAPIIVTLPPLGGAIDVVVDAGDGAPWVDMVGEWSFTPTNNPLLIGGGQHSDSNLGKGNKQLTFRPHLPEPGNYRVMFGYLGNRGLAQEVQVHVTHVLETTNVLVNLRDTKTNWVELGTFEFQAGDSAIVRVLNEATIKHVVVDAVRWIK